MSGNFGDEAFLCCVQRIINQSRRKNTVTNKCRTTATVQISYVHMSSTNHEGKRKQRKGKKERHKGESAVTN
jgi:hypothetical protein